MKGSTNDIKKIADQIERASAVGNKLQLEKLMDEMIHTCRNIKLELEEKKKISNDIKLEEINTIPFVYKPVLRKDYYEGTYLEEFAERRTSELKDAKALDVHNRFWQNHEVLRGNVFGSVPAELIGKDAVDRLTYFGWDEVLVNVLEVQERKCDMKDLVEHCELHYSHFLIVNEKSTNTELILNYNI
jgi:hypothetical protein